MKQLSAVAPQIKSVLLKSLVAQLEETMELSYKQLRGMTHHLGWIWKACGDRNPPNGHKELEIQPWLRNMAPLVLVFFRMSTVSDNSRRCHPHSVSDSTIHKGLYF